MFKFKRYDTWKLQRPISWSEGHDPGILIYTEDKDDITTIPMDQETIDELFGSELKVYVRGYVQNGLLYITERVEEQDW